MKFDSYLKTWPFAAGPANPECASEEGVGAAVQHLAFERERIGVPKALTDAGQGQFALGDAESRHCLSALVRDAELAAPDLSALELNVDPVSLISVTGASTAVYSFSAWAQSQSGSMNDLAQLPQLIQLTRDQQRVLFTAPEDLSARGYMCYLDVVGPADRPVSIDATWAAVDVFGVLAAVKISCGHGRVSAIDTANNVDVIATQGGHIRWSGRKGKVHLDARSICPGLSSAKIQSSS
jgi:hypothetical protein